MNEVAQLIDVLVIWLLVLKLGLKVHGRCYVVRDEAYEEHHEVAEDDLYAFVVAQFGIARVAFPHIPQDLHHAHGTEHHHHGTAAKHSLHGNYDPTFSPCALGKRLKTVGNVVVLIVKRVYRKTAGKDADPNGQTHKTCLAWGSQTAGGKWKL